MAPTAVPIGANHEPPVGGTSTQRNPYAEMARAKSTFDTERSTTQPDGNTSDSELDKEAEARRQFIDDWRARIDRRKNGDLSQEGHSRRRSRSLDGDDAPADDSPPSPTSFSNRSKTARQACCDCSCSAPVDYRCLLPLLPGWEGVH